MTKTQIIMYSILVACVSFLISNWLEIPEKVEMAIGYHSRVRALEMDVKDLKIRDKELQDAQIVSSRIMTILITEMGDAESITGTMHRVDKNGAPVK